MNINEKTEETKDQAQLERQAEKSDQQSSLTPKPMPKPEYQALASKVISLALEMGLILALPIVILGLVGKWLDHKMHTGFWIYIGIALAITSSTIWLTKRLGQMAQDLENLNKKDTK